MSCYVGHVKEKALLCTVTSFLSFAISSETRSCKERKTRAKHVGGSSMTVVQAHWAWRVHAPTYPLSHCMRATQIRRPSLVQTAGALAAFGMLNIVVGPTCREMWLFPPPSRLAQPKCLRRIRALKVPAEVRGSSSKIKLGDVQHPCLSSLWIRCCFALAVYIVGTYCTVFFFVSHITLLN